MQFKNWLKATVLTATVITTACSKDDDNGKSGGDPYGQRRIDTSDFKNTASEADLKSRGSKVDGYFASLADLKNGFKPVAKKVMASGMSLAAEVGVPECTTEETEEWDDLRGGTLHITTTTCITEEASGFVKTCVEVLKETLDGNRLSDLTTCTSLAQQQNEETTVEVGTEDQPFEVEFSEVQTCDDAFANFDKSYANVKTEFDNIYGMLMSPTGLNLASGGLSDQGELKKVESDDKSAVTYQVIAPETGGMKMDGTISGGANGDVMLLRQKVVIDMSQMTPTVNDPSMPQMPDMPNMPKMKLTTDESIAVDAAQKLIETDIDLTMTMTVNDGKADQTTTMVSKGRVAVSAGDDKFVTMVMDFGTAGTEQSASHVTMESHLVDANTLTFNASVSAQGAAGGEMSFRIVRDATGRCEVQDLKNTLAE